jgi:hypothetical protein
VSDILHLRGPGNLDTVLHGLIGRTFLSVNGKGPVSLFSPFGGDLHLVSEPYLRDFQNAFHILNVSFHVSGKVVRGRDSPRIQRSGKGARESPGDPCDHMVQSRRILRPGDLTPVLFFVKAPDPSVNAEVERIGKTLNIGRAMGALVLVNTDVTRVCYGHDSPSFRKVLHLN